MKMTIWRVTSKDVDHAVNDEGPFRMHTRLEEYDDAITQEEIEDRVLIELRRRLEALTNGAASNVEITIQLIDEE